MFLPKYNITYRNLEFKKNNRKIKNNILTVSKYFILTGGTVMAGIYSVRLNGNRIPYLVKDSEMSPKEYMLDNSDAFVNMINAVFHLDEMPQEHLVIVSCTNKGKPIGLFDIATGTIDECLVSPRDIFTRVILTGGAAFVMIHNHPSGDPEPSVTDIKLCSKIKDLSEMMGIHFWDSIVIGVNNKYVSLREQYTNIFE